MGRRKWWKARKGKLTILVTQQTHPQPGNCVLSRNNFIVKTEDLSLPCLFFEVPYSLFEVNFISQGPRHRYRLSYLLLLPNTILMANMSKTEGCCRWSDANLNRLELQQNVKPTSFISDLFGMILFVSPYDNINQVHSSVCSMARSHSVCLFFTGQDSLLFSVYTTKLILYSFSVIHLEKYNHANAYWVGEGSTWA